MNQAFDSVVVTNPKEQSKRRSKQIKLISGFVSVTACLICIVVMVTDDRYPEQTVEEPMIKEFKTLPSGMTSD